jgi:hypothetical protein
VVPSTRPTELVGRPPVVVLVSPICPSLEESWVRDRGLSEACLFIPKFSVHLLLLITIVLATTRRDLVVSTERGPYLVRAVHSL